MSVSRRRAAFALGVSAVAASAATKACWVYVGAVGDFGWTYQHHQGLEAVKKEWSDATLLVEDDMYGERWPRGMTLQALISHQIHHRGQMTVLMRQAGLSVPGVYGPAREEWAAYGMEPPAV